MSKLVITQVLQTIVIDPDEHLIYLTNYHLPDIVNRTTLYNACLMLAVNSDVKHFQPTECHATGSLC